MEHVASIPSAGSGRMSPEAVALAMLLHALAALALWALAMYRPILVPPEDPVEITLEQPKPPDPPPPPQPQPKPTPQPAPPIEALRPPAEITADKPTQVRPSGEAPKDVAAPAQRSLEDSVPKPAAAPPPPAETAMAAPTPPEPKPAPPAPRPPLFRLPTPGPTVEPMPPRPIPAPTVEPPPPPRPSPPVPTPPAVAHPQPHPAPPPPAVTPHTQPNPSPLVAPRPQAQPPAVARHQDTPTPPSSPFVNPADEHNRATAEQNYLWEVVRKLRGYRYHAQVQMVEGLTVVQIVVARNGQLLDAQVVRSSGQAGMDQGVLAGVRQGSPYTPLPPTISGPSATFRLPLVSVPEQQ